MGFRGLGHRRSSGWHSTKSIGARALFLAHIAEMQKPFHTFLLVLGKWLLGETFFAFGHGGKIPFGGSLLRAVICSMNLRRIALICAQNLAICARIEADGLLAT